MEKYLVIYSNSINTQPLGVHLAEYNSTIDKYIPVRLEADVLQEIANELNKKEKTKCQE